MGRKQTPALLAALISTPLWAQSTGNLLINPGFQQGLSGWSETGPGGTYNGCGPAGGVCYVFSYDTGIVQQTIVAPETYTGYSVNFQYRLPCNNSIGGYCTNPSGPQDWLTANLGLYLGDTLVEDIQLLALQAYQPAYSTFSLSGSTENPFNVATINFRGQDTGFWAGPYGPQIDNVSVSFSSPTPVQEEATVTPISLTPEPTPVPNPVAIFEEEEQIAAVEEAIEEAVDAAEEVGIALVEEVIEEETVAEESAAEAEAEEAAQEDDSTAEDADGPAPPPGLLLGSSSTSSSSESTTTASGTRRDRNVDFFQSEATAEADLFARETVLQANLQNVAFIAQADAQYAQQYGEQTTTETVGTTYVIQPAEGPTFVPVVTTTIGGATTSSGQAQQIELLGMGMQGDLSAGPVVDVGDVNTGDGETMAQLGAVPAGYGAYTQARIPDAPFYQPREIYKGRRIPDANMVLYRIMQANDARWQEMVDEQYE